MHKDSVINFAMWLTTRPAVITVGGSETVYAMNDALTEYFSMPENKDDPLERLTETGIVNAIAAVAEAIKGDQQPLPLEPAVVLITSVLLNINRIADALEKANVPVNVEDAGKSATRSFIGQREG